jgi:hypothetical protein
MPASANSFQANVEGQMTKKELAQSLILSSSIVDSISHA